MGHVVRSEEASVLAAAKPSVVELLQKFPRALPGLHCNDPASEKRCACIGECTQFFPLFNVELRDLDQVSLFYSILFCGS